MQKLLDLVKFSLELATRWEWGRRKKKCRYGCGEDKATDEEAKMLYYTIGYCRTTNHYCSYANWSTQFYPSSVSYSSTLLKNKKKKVFLTGKQKKVCPLLISTTAAEAAETEAEAEVEINQQQQQQH